MVQVEVAASGRAGCRICGSKIQRGELRVGVPALSEWGESMRWHHASCIDGTKFAASAADVSGYGALSAADKAKLEQSFQPKLAPSPIRPPSAAGAAPPSAAATPTGKMPAAAAAQAAAAAVSLPEQLKEQPPFERGICKIEYAKAKKPSNCKLCSGPIRNGEPRVGDSQPSAFYEGLQTRWLCLSCALNSRSRLVGRFSQLAGWDRMGYDCSREVRQATGELLSEAAELELQARMQPLEALTDALTANHSVPELVGALRQNGVDTRATGLEADSISMAHFVADGMLTGLCADCPCCGMCALHFASGRVACAGSLGGLTRCPYRAAPADVKRFRFELPAEMREAEWLVEWLAPGARGKQPAGAKRKQAAALAAPSVGSRALAGLSLTTRKPIDLDAMPDANPPPPAREVPEPGCPLLEVHRGFKQTGEFHRAQLLLGADGVTVYSAHLNQVAVQKNINRYYVVQALLVSGCPEVFCHWGATGCEELEELGGVKLKDNYKRYKCASAQDAIALFESWFLKKTNCCFADRHAFRLTPGWYNYEELSTRAPGGSAAHTPARIGGAAGARVAPCSLPEPVAALVGLLFDEDAILSTMHGSGIDCGRQGQGGFTLHSLTPGRLDKARRLLDQLAQLLANRPSDQPPAAPPAAPPDKSAPAPQQPVPGARSRAGRAVRATSAAAGKRAAAAEAAAVAAATSAPPSAAEQARLAWEQSRLIWSAKLEAASNEFQQTVPAREPVRIDSAELLADKARTLDLLADILSGQELLRQQQQQQQQQQHAAQTASGEAGGSAAAADGPLEPHPLDVKHASLKCGLRHLPRDGVAFRAVADAVANTSAPHERHADGLCGFTHRTQDGVELLDVFELEREGERQAHDARFGELGNRALLWHGTGVGCAAAIVAQGLRITRGSGGRVGRGIYLADQIHKSGHYTLPSKRGEAVMFLAEAALGRAHRVHIDQPHLRRAPDGFDSVVTESHTAPDERRDVRLQLDGRAVRFATGPVGERELHPDVAPACRFAQSEYLVYDEQQLRLRFLVKLRI